MRASRFDLLRVPLLGRFLRWRRSRLCMQLALLLVSVVMIAHAFWGPQLAPKNLGVLLTWVHFRGLVVLAILLAGNLFCMACPFMLPRELARRWHSPRWKWPRRLSNKWPAILLFVAVLYCYELFDLWSDPWWTGVMIVAYFGAATLVDSLFQGASFCKHVCPIGQFNFLSSALAPLEVGVRHAEVCTTCLTKDCIRGRRPPADSSAAVREPHGFSPSGPLAIEGPRGLKPRGSLPVLQRGCELRLFQPRKVGNMDCTFCLDCVYACPHDNVGVLPRLPAAELTVTGPRSGVGRIERRLDYSVLVSVFTFGALLNAFLMISPVYALEQAVARMTGLRVEWPILAGLFCIALVIEPAVLLGSAAILTRRSMPLSESVLSIIKRFARSLVPLGFGVWLAHYGFHFFTGVLTVIPVSQYAVLHAFDSPLLGEPLWQLGGVPARLVLPLEMAFMSLGLLGSWIVAWSIAHEIAPLRPRSAFLPWALVHALLFAAGVWIMRQPMDMRGTFLGG